MMDMTIRPLRAEERKYLYPQSSQLRAQTGSIGYLRGDFGRDGDEFWSTWFDVAAHRKTETFRAELGEVINALRFGEEYGGLLAGRAAMRKYGAQSPESAFEERDTTQYGFRIDTTDYAYLLRCNPVRGDYNFYCWCFEGKWLDAHLQESREGIRFIDPHYNEKFRIPDGDKIRIHGSDGSEKDYTCRYIDSCHMEIDGGWSNLYHICQFAEIMERNENTVIPLRSSLPEQCFSTLPSTGELISIRKGEKGYTPCPALCAGSPEENRAFADSHNAQNHVTKAQEAAMLAGSMFGWGVPAADPSRYDAQGHPQKFRRRQEQREAR